MNATAEGRVMQDKIEKIGNSIVQHGKSNDRIYLMKLALEDAPDIIPIMKKLVQENGYTKIFAKIPSDTLPYFVVEEFVTEAFIPRFYNDTVDCLMVSKFMNNKRNHIAEDELAIFKSLLEKSNKGEQKKYKDSIHFEIGSLKEKDAPGITEIFRKVFETYPFPVHDSDYLVQTMKENGTRYFGVWDKEKLIGVSTAEVDAENKNAEMTDFAVLPEYRGQKLAFRLLMKMEVEMKINNIKTVYTIARLKEPGMNKTFLNSGYKYTGTLVNNTNISGSIESMNVLYKHL